MYRNVVTKMSPDETAQTESARRKSPVPCDLTVAMINKLQMVSSCVVIRTIDLLH